MIGNTQGIRFKINPPKNAKRIAERTESVSGDSSACDNEALIINDSSLTFKIPSIDFGVSIPLFSGTMSDQLFSSFIKVCSLA